MAAGGLGLTAASAVKVAGSDGVVKVLEKKGNESELRRMMR